MRTSVKIDVDPAVQAAHEVLIPFIAASQADWWRRPGWPGPSSGEYR